ncbi:deoxyribodipyrimidine photo-lyase [Methylomonas sp. AM2-LC]|uniref:cryptochrome/photolyase family protein n=1 Tax=Methylomonas sp. AM2-LC TaxID=3153301 RepID=UPI003265C709
MKPYAKSLFIFRRDLRIEDNTALNAALAQSEQVIAVFIFNPLQIEAHPYQSHPALQFMLEALQDLQRQFTVQGGKLYFYTDNPENVITRLHTEHQIAAVFVNRDYTPFSLQRDSGIQQRCQTLGIDFHSHADLLLNEPEQVLNKTHTPYQVFSAFYKRARQNPVKLPKNLHAGNFCSAELYATSTDWQTSLKQTHTNVLTGGRQPALALLHNGLSACKNYSLERDYPSLTATSTLSAYLKFGCCSIREAYYATLQQFDAEHPLLRQFYWRDFFTHIAYHYPYVFGHAFHRRYDNIEWQNQEPLFLAWTQGMTGFPIIDAGMRELNQTGLMHNRVRMLVASFLVKDLHISWRWGERYFAQHLLDYDPCVNNGNWQWAASTGCDAQPYFRVFNPWLQQRKFDADCRYIKRWVPELAKYSTSQIHQWQQPATDSHYPAPIVDHAEQTRQVKALYKIT